MIDMSPRQWAAATVYAPTTSIRYSTAKLTPREWVVRHGLWIFLLVIVTVWEALGFVFPVAAKTPEWWDHPTISQEIKRIIGTSLPGRIIATCVMVVLSTLLTLHWAWRIPA